MFRRSHSLSSESTRFFGTGGRKRQPGHSVFRLLHNLTLPMVFCALFSQAGCREKATTTIPNEAIESPAKTSAEDTPRELPVLGEVPQFDLTDQDGNPFQREALDGKVWVATFIFTRCNLTCPLQTKAFSQLQTSLRSKKELDNVNLVSFTVDPEFDTPEVLAKYGRNAGANFKNWHFLTGDRGELWDLSKDGFKMDVQSGRDETTLISHSQNFILVDHESKIRGYYAGLNAQANAKLLQDIDRLLDASHPDRTNKLSEVSKPEDVRAPTWLTERAESQKATAADLNVVCDFAYSDRLETSGITFQDEVVEDVKSLFKAAHYDHGSAVAVADVDGDDLLDIYFVSQFGSNELWKNLGDGTFDNITETAGVAVVEGVGVGASFADVDNDGDADLYVTRVRAPNRLFLNDGTGKFQDVSEGSGLDHVGHSSGSVFFDYDRDGLLDLLLTNVGKYTTEELGPGGYHLAYPAAFTGHLHKDRAEPNILFRNLGDAQFQNVNEQVGFDDVSWSGDATAMDANNDGWPDIYLLSMQGHDEYYENQNGKSFVRKSRELFPVTPWGTMGVKVFDYNRDGELDLFVTDMHTDMVEDMDPAEEKKKMRRNLPINMLATDGNHILGNAVYRKDGKNQFTEVSDDINAENYWPWGISVADLNADGYEDVFIAASMSYPYRYGINSVLLNDAGQNFVDSEFILGVEPCSKGTAQPWMQLDCSGEHSDLPPCKDIAGKVIFWGAIGTRSSVIFDIEGDGDLDIVTNDFGGTPRVLVSDLQAKKKIHFLKVKLEGKDSNRDGLGAVVQVSAGNKNLLSPHDGKSGYLSQSRMPLYFGLGDAMKVDRIEVTWPSGLRQVLEGPIDANRTLTITETVQNE